MILYVNLPAFIQSLKKNRDEKRNIIFFSVCFDIFVNYGWVTDVVACRQTRSKRLMNIIYANDIFDKLSSARSFSIREQMSKMRSMGIQFFNLNLQSESHGIFSPPLPRSKATLIEKFSFDDDISILTYRFQEKKLTTPLKKLLFSGILFTRKV